MKEFTKCEKNDILFDEIITLVEDGVIPPEGRIIKLSNWHPEETPYWKVEYPYSLDEFYDIDDFLNNGIVLYSVPEDLQLAGDWSDMIEDNTWELASYSEADNFGKLADTEYYDPRDEIENRRIERQKLRKLGLDN